MQRTFITEMPETLNDNQVVVELPRYEMALTKAFVRRDINNASRFLSDVESLNVITTLNQVKMFVDELANLDKDIDTSVRIPYNSYVGLPFNKTGDAVKWSRNFVRRFFPDTEERLLKKSLLNISFTKTEIVWLGDEKYLPFIERIATSPSTDALTLEVETKKPQITREEATKLRAEIAAKKNKKD